MNKPDLLKEYARIRKEIKKEFGTRTSNDVGEIGEWYALDFYNTSNNLPSLEKASTNQRSIDAHDPITKKTYSIKTRQRNGGRMGGSSDIHGYKDSVHKLFDFLLFVVLDEDFQLEQIYQIDWATFDEFKRPHRNKNGIYAYVISLSKKVKEHSLKLLP